MFRKPTLNSVSICFLFFGGHACQSSKTYPFWFVFLKTNSPGQGVPYSSRANKKLFTMECIGPSTTAYAHISQKMLKGAASRLIIYWLTPILVKKAQKPDALRHELQSGYISTCFFFNLCWRMGNDCENMVSCLGSDSYARYMANVFLALTAIHTTLAAHGTYGLQFQRVLMVQMYRKIVCFLGGAPGKKTIWFKPIF